VRLLAKCLTRAPAPLCRSTKAGAFSRLKVLSLRSILGRMARKPQPPNLFWLAYRHSDGRSAGVVVIESGDLLHARLKASLAGVDRELEFASGHQLDPVSAEQVPANMIGRFLDDGDLRKLHRMLIKKKPPAPSVRRRTAAKLKVGKR
jgi:hypothetical protein